MGPFTFNMSRSLLAGLFLLPVIAVFRRAGGSRTKDSVSGQEAPESRGAQRKTLLTGSVSCGVILFISSNLQQIGIQYTTVGKAGFITAMYIILVPVLSLFLHKKAGIKLWISVVVAVAGLYLLCMSGSLQLQKGDLLVLRAHAAARDAIKAICPQIKVGLTLSLHDLQAQPGGEAFAEAAWQEEFTHYLPYIKEDDFLGVQNYTRTLYGPQGQLPAPEGAELTQMDYEVYPQALEHVLRKVAEEFKGDLMVTENGIATADDTRRVAFIRQALDGVQHCIADGISVKGYFHWSLMDNFEWQKGYAMNFGLIAVNRETMGRTPKPSLAALGSYANA